MAIWNRRRESTRVEQNYELFTNKEGFVELMNYLTILLNSTLPAEGDAFDDALCRYNNGTECFYYRLTEEEIFEIRNNPKKMEYFKMYLVSQCQTQLAKRDLWTKETTYYVIGQAFKAAHFF